MKSRFINPSTLKISLVLGILILIMPGCLDIWITTTIRPDGSLEQSISFTGDSTEITTSNFAFIKESGWKNKWTKIDKDKWELITSKEFKNVKELNASMNPADTSRQYIRVNSTLQRKFRWFFTRFVYTQTIKEANPYRVLDNHQYLTDEEIRMISLKEENRKSEPGFDSIRYKAAENKFEEYILRSMYEDYYRQLELVLSENKSFTLITTELSSKKELLYHYLVDSVNQKETVDILIGTARFLKHPDIDIIREKYLNRFDGFQQRMKFYEKCSDDSYKFSINMPGLLLQTNSTKVEDSGTYWELSYYDFFFKDYTMSAESRKVNTWAFILAGLVLLIAIGGLVGAMLRTRKGHVS